MTLADELEDYLKQAHFRSDDLYYPRVINLLQAKLKTLRDKDNPQPKRKTVVGYVGSRHTKIKVQGLFEDKDEG